jgi:DNA-binding phage protein
MQKLLLLVALTATVVIHAQEPALSPVLAGYFNVKDALVKDDVKAAAAAAGRLLAAINGVNMSALPAKDHTAFMTLQNKLAYDARHISESTEIAHQREHFASLSSNMATLAKQAQLSRQPIYEDYCPMKKVYWLNGDTTIRNPYFGSSMLTCGKITHTLKP